MAHSNQEESSDTSQRLNAIGSSGSTHVDTDLSFNESDTQLGIEAILKIQEDLEKIQWAQEIATNENFLLEKKTLPDNCLENIVRKNMFQAYWDIMEQDLNLSPPDYKSILLLFNDIKQTLLSMLLSDKSRLKTEIEEKLDMELIEQQMSSATIDLISYGQCVVDLMARLCSESRDENINALRNINEIIPLYRAIMETLELMRIDVGNFFVGYIRPLVKSIHSDYERKKFQEYLQATNDPLLCVSDWLKRNLCTQSETSDAFMKTLTDSYLEILDWDEHFVFPKTLTFQSKNYLRLSSSIRKIVLIASICHIVGDFLTQFHCTYDRTREFLPALCNSLMAITETQRVSFNSEVLDLLKNLALQCEQEVKKSSDLFSSEQQINSEKFSYLQEKICQLQTKDHPLIVLFYTRVRRMIVELLECTSTSQMAQVSIPSGLKHFSQKLGECVLEFRHLVTHNQQSHVTMYRHLYSELLTDSVRTQ